ncbi:hypothetical protein PBY51_001145 [Eleginops maclovinus]|uniref:Uncharacterized protein n=1 Tax=Eleginops maclovinus TaxID=56733 RepID=A0AAN7XL96_ELEMC|nr:hypothetical protein PBY51_001145 [Eleginops maclovinus]
MEPVFLRFDSFDFGSDRRFQDGLKGLNTDCREEEKLLELKIFFYNRFVEPIDRTGYREWRKHPDSENREETRGQTSGDTSTEPRETSAGTSGETEEKQLSFAAVMRLVQAGQEVPGATKLEIKPTNTSPTASQMQRRLKPWET